VLSRFRFVRTIDVRFRDLDAIGHVNNATFLTYLEDVRIAWWLHVTHRDSLKDLDMILARAEVDYRSALEMGESVEVGVGCTSLGRSSFVLEFDMVERASGRLVAEARKVMVYYDYASGRSRPLTPAVRDMILAQDPDARQG
jgi:acyl-CoA thioester hydrolase